MINKIDRGFNNTTEEIAGPGHRPTIPQPTPKRAEPKINFLFIFLTVGISKREANNGLFVFRNK